MRTTGAPDSVMVSCQSCPFSGLRASADDACPRCEGPVRAGTRAEVRIARRRGAPSLGRHGERDEAREAETDRLLRANREAAEQ